MSIDPSLWGESGWVFLHSIALAYPNNPSDIDKKNIKNFFTITGDVLPCTRCRDNFKQHLKKFPLSDEVLSSKLGIVTWINNINNEVDKEVAKMKKQNAENEKNKGKNTESDTTITLIIIIIVCLLAYYLTKKV